MKYWVVLNGLGGYEYFEYDSREEQLAGVGRLCETCATAFENDGFARHVVAIPPPLADEAAAMNYMENW